MRKIIISSSKKFRKVLPKIKEKIDIHTDLKKDYVIINGEELNEVIVEKIIKAVDFGFELEDALLLVKDDWEVEYINIKDHTRRRNLEEVRSRVIGKDGKAKNTIANLTGSSVVIHDNIVGIICDIDHLAYSIQGIISLIQGAKHSNVFSYIEKQNRKLRKLDSDDLGLRNPEKDLAGLQ